MPSEITRVTIVSGVGTSKSLLTHLYKLFVLIYYHVSSASHTHTHPFHLAEWTDLQSAEVVCENGGGGL